MAKNKQKEIKEDKNSKPEEKIGNLMNVPLKKENRDNAEEFDFGDFIKNMREAIGKKYSGEDSCSEDFNLEEAKDVINSIGDQLVKLKSAKGDDMCELTLKAPSDVIEKILRLNSPTVLKP